MIGICSFQYRLCGARINSAQNIEETQMNVTDALKRIDAGWAKKPN